MVKAYDVAFSNTCSGLIASSLGLCQSNSKEFQSSSLVSGLSDIGFQDFTCLVDGPPQIVVLTGNPYEGLIDMPAPQGIAMF